MLNFTEPRRLFDAASKAVRPSDLDRRECPCVYVVERRKRMGIPSAVIVAEGRFSTVLYIQFRAPTKTSAWTKIGFRSLHTFSDFVPKLRHNRHLLDRGLK